MAKGKTNFFGSRSLGPRSIPGPSGQRDGDGETENKESKGAHDDVCLRASLANPLATVKFLYPIISINPDIIVRSDDHDA